MNNSMDEINEGVEFEDEAPTETQLASIEEMVRRARELELEIDTVEAHLKSLTKEFIQIVEKDLPARMVAAGTNAFETTNGLKVKIARDIFASELKDTQKKLALARRRAQWLTAHGGESLIRESVEVAFEKGDNFRVASVIDALEKIGVPYVRGENINTSSMKAFVRDVMQNEEVPLDDLGFYQKTEAKISAADQHRKGRK